MDPARSGKSIRGKAGGVAIAVAALALSCVSTAEARDASSIIAAARSAVPPADARGNSGPNAAKAMEVIEYRKCQSVCTEQLNPCRRGRTVEDSQSCRDTFAACIDRCGSFEVENDRSTRRTSMDVPRSR